jgi:hypothetical protein
MTAILNSKLKQDEKITLYGKALSKFISINNPEATKASTILATLNSKVDKMSKTIEDELEIKKELVPSNDHSSTVDPEIPVVKRENVATIVKTLLEKYEDLQNSINEQNDFIDEHIDAIDDPSVKIDYEKLKQMRKNRLEADPANIISGKRARTQTVKYGAAPVLSKAAKTVTAAPQQKTKKSKIPVIEEEYEDAAENAQNALTETIKKIPPRSGWNSFLPNLY